MWSLGIYPISLLLCLLALVCHTCGHVQHGTGERITISWEILLSLRTSPNGVIATTIPVELLAPPHPDRGASPRRPSVRKRGDIRRRLKSLCLDNRRRLPPLPPIFVSKAQSLRRKVDELEIWVKHKPEMRSACILAITESWLGKNDLDSDLALTGFGCPIRLDRSHEVMGKRRGGRLLLLHQ